MAAKRQSDVTATVPVKQEASKKVEVVDRPARFEWPDLFGWDFPDLFRFRDREMSERGMRIEEEVRDGAIVIRAEMPGIDPDNDVEVTLDDGVLHIHAERRTKEESNGRVRSEFHYGSYTRSLPLPKGASSDDVRASYRDGILEVTVPVANTGPEPTKIAVSRK